MKRTIFSLSVLFFISILNAQVPQAFKYQAVVRDNTGNLLIEQSVNFQIDILKGAVDGSTIYSETHTASTNSHGLVNLEIGSGTTTDDFLKIDWGSGLHFIKIWVNGEEMGTSQLLSVPYALHAETAENVNVPVYTSTEIVALSPEEGDVLYNITENLYQIYIGNSWVASFHGSCWPEPTTANAGDDQILTDLTSVTLSANTPEISHGTGAWSIISGEGGSFTDATNPTTTFTGQQTDYILRWTISTTCNSSSDDVNIMTTPPWLSYLTGASDMPDGKTWTFSQQASTGDGIFYADAAMTLQDPIPDGIFSLIGLPSEYEDEFIFKNDLSYSHDVKNDSAVTNIVYALLNQLEYRPSAEDMIVLAPFTPAAATFTYTENTNLTLEVTSEADPENIQEVTWSNVDFLEIEGGTEFVGINDFTRIYIIFDISVDHLQIGMFFSATSGSKANFPSHLLKMTLVPKQ